MKKIKIKLCVLFWLFGFNIYAQEATIPSGGDAAGSGGTVSYSIGQVAYTTSSGVTGESTEGVQQTYEILTAAVNKANAFVSLELYPSPTQGDLTLKINDFKDENLSFQIFDVKGTFLAKDEITEAYTKIDMGALPAATYFIDIIQGSKKIQSYKIIKN